MKYNRFLPLLIPFIIFIFSEVFFFWPKMIYISLALGNLLIFFTVNQFIKTGGSGEKWWNFLILPSVFFIALSAYSVLKSGAVIQILFLLNAAFLYFYLRSIYYFLVQPLSFRKNDFENISSTGGFLSFFFISSAVYGLVSFLNFSFWPLVVILIAASFLILYQFILVNAGSGKNHLIYIISAALILAELAWVISFLPLNFNLSGLILSVFYYLMSGLIKAHLLDRLNKKTVESYLFFSFGVIFITLLTARWM